MALADGDFLYLLSTNAVLLVVLVLASIDHRVWMHKAVDQTVYEAIGPVRGWTIAKPILMVCFLVVSFAFLVGDSYNPFLYFRF